LGWANHSWYAKTWNKDSKDKLLIEQTYTGIEDAREHFNYLLKAFKDSRYLKIDGKPYLFIFDPVSLPDIYIEKFTEWAQEQGYPGLYLVANISPYEDKDEYIRKGYTAVSINRVSKSVLTKTDIRKRKISDALYKIKIFEYILKIRRHFLKRLKPSPVILDYTDYYKQLITEQDYESDVIPQIVPQWDHSPRSGIYGLTWINTTPSLFYNHACMALDAVKEKKNPIIILKSWNEWGEGNYMEPDLKHGTALIDTLAQELRKIRL
jgi:hypothetical protein